MESPVPTSSPVVVTGFVLKVVAPFFLVGFARICSSYSSGSSGRYRQNHQRPQGKPRGFMWRWHFKPQIFESRSRLVRGKSCEDHREPGVYCDRHIGTLQQATFTDPSSSFDRIRVKIRRMSNEPSRVCKKTFTVLHSERLLYWIIQNSASSRPL